MALDKEQQARLTFLSEAETYFGEIESVLLALKTADDRSTQINVAMRAAHSVKGTAGMMNFSALSQVAHRLEDSFKILQARQLSMDTHLETLLLQGVDCLRTVRQRHYEQQPVGPQWLATHVDPVFEQLHQRLGDLTPEDEARLLSEETDEDLDVIIFTTSVEDCLDAFEQDLPRLSGEDLRQAVVEMARQLSEFGLMAQLASFVTLCQSVQQQCMFAQPEAVDAIARQALGAWRRSHSLVLLGRTEGLPTQLKPLGLTLDATAPTPEPLTDPAIVPDLLDISADDISLLQAQLAALEVTGDLTAAEIAGDPISKDTLTQAEIGEANRVDLYSDLHTELAESLQPLETAPASILEASLEIAPAEILEATLETAPEKTLETVSKGPLEGGTPSSPEPIEVETIEAIETIETLNVSLEDSSAIEAPADKAVEVPLMPLGAPTKSAVSNPVQPATVRVSVDQLKQINRLFESLILNRNAINLRLDQLQAFSLLMQERMTALASFNKELRQWYDQASTEGLLPESFGAEGLMSKTAGTSESELVRRLINTHGGANRSVAVADPGMLDVLELDRYSRLHLLAQENMETIVKLEEVSRDINLGLSEMGQAVNDLGYTSQALKTRITQTQMRSFEEIVERFPRVVRDWSVQYDKLVTLNIEGETTLIEQFALDQLSDPLMHLLRNAFDHGIESPEHRRARKKPAMGTITLRAVNRGNRVVITLSDDGRGIDLDQVRDRIRQYDLPDEQVDHMDRQELLSFIFEPGFSTTGKVTELSGRGFGMDVVRTNLQRLQGDIQVATAPGQGTTFTLSIPLSLSILRVMLLERNDLIFALPIDAVQEIIRTPSLDENSLSLAWQDSSIPLIRLEEHWAVQCAARPIEMTGTPLINQSMVVVVGEGGGVASPAENRCYGLNIDRFWQEQEVAIRPVASPIPLPPGFSGTTLLGDGRVVPLIDPIRLMEWILERPKTLPAQTGLQEAIALDPPQSNAAKILVVDDSIHARRYLAISLEKAGYLVEQAKDGRDAVDKMIGGLSVEAIICDIEMPRLDGYGVLEKLRAQPDFSTVPILMLTSRSSEKHRKLAMNLGATAYFSKPYNEQELLKTLKQLAV
ncbi:MAG: hybrid sensor histidine kinase/response regulator [Cyanobacteria bacterium P01_G01_bin.38]